VDSEFYANTRAVIADVMGTWKPPPKLTLSQWADEYFRLSAESAAEPGRWRTLPYQRGIMDAVTDPTVTYISVMKSARVGYTLMASAAIAYHMHQAPTSIMVVQPTVEDAKGFSKETIAPMLRDVPALAGLTISDDLDGPKDASTILAKRFPGGVLSMVGANSGTGFRRVSRKIVIFDEVDGYPASAGSDGDPIKLGIKRSEYYWDRKIIAGSTPLVAGRSRIETLFEAGDQRRFFVPCPQCGHMDQLVFSERDSGGHFLEWPEDHPERAHMVCSQNGCVIEHHQKTEMISAGAWRAAKPFTGHASFHISALYSYSPNSTWADIAAEFLEAKRAPETLRVFVNTVLGEVWRERGDAPDWERLYSRRESYEIGTVPPAVGLLTAGMDVQKDRVVWEVVGWGPGKESWSIDSGIIPMDTSNEAEWTRVDELLNRAYLTSLGTMMTVRVLAVDSGYNTQAVYNYARRHVGRVIAVKGMRTAKTLLGSPSPVDVTWRGKRIARGCKVWPVGVDIAKTELYGWLRLPIPEEGGLYSGGFCHFPEHGPDFFKQLTSEQLVTVKTKQGYTATEWQVIPGRENHVLDARVYARAAAQQAGLDRLPLRPFQGPAPAQPPAQPQNQISDSPRALNRGKPWLKR
jgi:phage terminase large subunit GpA-like protein